MNSIKEIVYSDDQIEQVAVQLAAIAKQAAIITFTGPLGAGKTTMVRALLSVYGVTENVTSPTYTYVNRYKNKLGHIFYHFDLYRIESVEDFIAAGFNEYLYEPNSTALIEWPEVISSLLQEKVCSVSIAYTPNVDQRKMVIRIIENGS